MQDEKNDLPEGTDKIIVGASATTTSGDGANELNEETDVMIIEIDDRGPGLGSGLGSDIPSAAGGDTSTGIPSGGSDTAFPADTSGASGGKAAAMKEKLRSGGERLSGQAADKARGFVGQGLERSSEALSNVSRLVGDTAEGIDERLGVEYGDYARRAATAIEDAASSLATKDADELIDDTRNFVRKSPGVALAGAAVIGFALARLIKAGLDQTGLDRDRTGVDRETAEIGTEGGGRAGGTRDI
jgi:ElaB/YqjD/DUF883 family membrane-anchored ribosome-binding protein